MFSNLVLSHLIVFLLPFLLLLQAGPSPTPDPYPAVISLPARQPPASRLAAPSNPPPAPEVEHDLLPFVVIATIDGALHAVDRDGGKVRWTLKEGVEPLVGGGVRGKGNDEEYIVEPLSGSLYVFEEEEREGETPKIRKLPLSVEQLIELSPFTFPHSPSRIFTGSKHTSLLTIDLRTGQQLHCYSSLAGNMSNPETDCTCESEQISDDMEGRARSNRDVLFVGRTDYRLTIHTPPSTVSSVSGSSEVSGERRTAGVQEIIYSTYTPNSYDKPLAEFWAKLATAEELWEEDGQEAKKMRVELGYDGMAVGVELGGGVRWMTKLDNIGIAVYDILLPLQPASANPILVPQPPPHLPSLFPVPTHRSSAHVDILNKPASTYIGAAPLDLALPGDAMIEGTGRSGSSKRLLYALSSSSYPLINFAPPPRPGTLSNGSFLLSEDLPERDQLLPYLLDPPTELIEDASSRESTITESKPIKFKPQSGRAWIMWTAAVFAGIAFFGFTVFGLGRRAGVRQSTTPPAVDEKTPLLLAPNGVKVDEKSVSFAAIPHAESSKSALARSMDMLDGDAPAKKKPARRRVRGKKKPRNADAGSAFGDDDDNDEDERGESPPGTVRREEKPLPELPREISSTDLLHDEDKERLMISDTVIGFGSHGTVVLKGTWGGRPVAVKRLLSDFTRLASQEVKLLQASDDHPNVIRYYCQERRDNFLYIALDLCQASLADLIEAPDKHLELASVLDRKKALIQITSGLKHLHGMKIIHRDIKPQNVLVSKAKDGSLRMLVSDFGLARRLEQDQSSFAPTGNNLAGSLGWRAPECIRGQVRLNEGFDPTSSHSSASSSGSFIDLVVEGEEKDKKSYGRLTKAVDLFALGCLYFWVLMSGEHPYGAVYDRESNIVKGEVVNMAQLEVLGEEGWEARELIERMLASDPAARPDTTESLIHPFFWTPAKRLAFLCDASDRFEIMELDPPEPTLVSLEADAVSVVGRDWYSRCDKVFTSSLGKYRKYKGNSVRDLLRAMRNKKHHYQDLDSAAQRHMGALPAGFLHYFTSRYPTLFLHVHGVVRGSRLRHESMFEGYFGEGN
ncbi:hypothetical protein BCR39DRAFT_523577 [Naematelia encephala]|uniref:Uncharacterized protein n=1 Tax=Naematelia encephala TaxID=71784 RepID=A0A1Y2BBP9_9TREE|nr:hypothetical protein BCR39DRAFT_523577 [Naematelia encephala]